MTIREDRLQILRQPLLSRAPVGYQRRFVDNTFRTRVPCCRPPWLRPWPKKAACQASILPAYARRVLEPLLLDLSWSSSRLEGNRYSLLATQELFKRGTADNDLDAIMLLNHKAAIEFMVDAVPLHGLTSAVIGSLHALLMEHLLAHTDGLGHVRRTVVNIRDTTYIPIQAPVLLQEMLDHIVEKHG